MKRVGIFRGIKRPCAHAEKKNVLTEESIV